MLLHELNNVQRVELLKIVREIVVSNKEITAPEREGVFRLCREMGVSPISANSELNLTNLNNIFDTHTVRVIAMIELVHISLSDGSTCLGEDSIINGVRKSFGFTLDEFNTCSKLARDYSLLISGLSDLSKSIARDSLF